MILRMLWMLFAIDAAAASLPGFTFQIKPLGPAPKKCNFALLDDVPAGLKIHAIVFAGNRQHVQWNDVVYHFRDKEKLPLGPMPETPPLRGNNRPAPFGKFYFDGREYDYGELPPETKRIASGTNVHYGKSTRSRAESDAAVRAYFSVGVGRARADYHYDVILHQGLQAATSGFSNGSESFEVAQKFASRYPGRNGVVFVCDLTGQEILNVPAFRKHLGGRDTLNESEILIKGGRDPRTIRAAVIYENGKPVAFHTNPNFVEPAPQAP